MVTPDVLRVDAAKMDSLMEAFEHTFLHLIDLGGGDVREKDQATMAFYALRDVLQKVIVDADELCGHMEVCNAVYAINRVKKMEVS